MTFRQFLISIKDEDSMDSDFANDFLSDSAMKGRNFKTIQSLKESLPSRACEEARQAAKSCFKRFLTMNKE